MGNFGRKDSHTTKPHGAKPSKLVVGVTVGSSAFLFFRGQLDWLSQHGWDVTLVTSPGAAADQTAEREGVSLVGIPMARGISPLGDFKALAQWVRMLLRIRPAAVSVGTPKAALLGMLASRLLGIPKRLYVVRGLRLEGTRGALKRVLWLMEYVTMKCATDVIYVSHSLALECGHRGLLDSSKSWLIGSGSSNGVDAISVKSVMDSVDAASVRNDLGYGPNDFVVGFIGRVTKDKGVDTLIDTLKDPTLNESVKILLIGTIAEPGILQGAESLEHRISAIGRKDDVWKYFAVMDTLCLPTKREGFPNVVLEAAAAGIPTVTTTATGAIDSVVPHQTGLVVETGNVSALVAALNTLAGDKQKLRAMGKAAQNRVVEKFKPEIIWNGLDEILTDAGNPKYAHRFFNNVNHE